MLPGAISGSCHLDATQYRAFVAGFRPAVEQWMKNAFELDSRPRLGPRLPSMAARGFQILVLEGRCHDAVEFLTASRLGPRR